MRIRKTVNSPVYLTIYTSEGHDRALGRHRYKAIHGEETCMTTAILGILGHALVNVAVAIIKTKGKG